MKERERGREKKKEKLREREKYYIFNYLTFMGIVFTERDDNPNKTISSSSTYTRVLLHIGLPQLFQIVSVLCVLAKRPAQFHFIIVIPSIALVLLDLRCICSFGIRPLRSPTSGAP